MMHNFTIEASGTWPGLILLAAALLPACAPDGPSEPSAQRAKARVVLAEARAAHGSDVLDSATITFGFRGQRFTARHFRDGGFRYTRAYAGTTDVLASDTLYRTVGGERQLLSAKERRDLATVVNSVVYFALLPEALADPAVRPRYLGADTVRGEPYHEIGVTFRKRGGGRDWRDRFVYWIHERRHTIDYLAYYFHVDGGGSRFREATGARTVGGARFQDYLNYKAATDTLGPEDIERFDEIMTAGGLEKASEVRLDSVRVGEL